MKSSNYTFHYYISVKSIKTHFYYSMKNCEGDPDKLRRSLTNIVEHYKVCLTQ